MSNEEDRRTYLVQYPGTSEAKLDELFPRSNNNNNDNNNDSSDNGNADLLIGLFEALLAGANGGGGPLKRERAAEDARVKTALNDSVEIVSHIRYGYDGDSNFLIVAKSAALPSICFKMSIILSDRHKLTYKEVRAIRDCLSLVERGSKISVVDFMLWGAALELKHGNAKVAKDSQGNPVMTIRPANCGHCTDAGMIQKCSFGWDQDKDWVVIMQTDTEKFIIVINSTEIDESYSRLEAKALTDCLLIAEPGDKMDSSIFLQHCARLRKAYNLLKVVRSNAGDMTAHIVPSSLSAADAGVNLQNEFSIPEVHEREVEWSPETRARVNGAGGGGGGAAAGGGGSVPGAEDRQVGITCDVCDKSNFTGVRYHCTQCHDYDLCAGCKHKESKNHKIHHKTTVITAAETTKRYYEARQAHYVMAMASSKAGPLVKERAREELAMLGADSAQKEVITRVHYSLDKDDDFALVCTGPALPNINVVLCVVLKDAKNLTWREGKAVRDCLMLGERGTKLTLQEFNRWEGILKGRHASCRVTRNPGQLGIIIRPDSTPTAAPAGKIERMHFVKDSDNDWVISFRTSFEKFAICVDHSLSNDSYAKLQEKAFLDCLAVADPMEKMDLSIFLQQCARLRKKYNLLKVVRSGGVVVCHIVPSTLSVTAAQVTLASDFAIPDVHARDLDWSAETYARLGNAVPPPPPPGGGGAAANMPRYNDGKIYGTKLLKESGQADVYAGMRTAKNGTTTEVAIKVYHKEEDWNDCKEELMALLKIPDHANVMGVLDFYEVPKPCVVMRLVKGEDLNDYIEHNGALRWEQGVQVLIGMCEGLAHLHRNDIAHRDLKSPNVLLELPSMTPVLIDLGLGKKMDGEISHKTRAGKGTIPWMAPEMMTNNSWGYYTDIFAVGIMMWEIFSGKSPYEAEGFQNAAQIIAHVLASKRPKIDLVRNAPGVPSAFVGLMERCWHQDHLQRPQAEAIVNELNALKAPRRGFFS